MKILKSSIYIVVLFFITLISENVKADGCDPVYGCITVEGANLGDGMGSDWESYQSYSYDFGGYGSDGVGEGSAGITVVAPKPSECPPEGCIDVVAQKPTAMLPPPASVAPEAVAPESDTIVVNATIDPCQNAKNEVNKKTASAANSNSKIVIIGERHSQRKLQAQYFNIIKGISKGNAKGVCVAIEMPKAGAPASAMYGDDPLNPQNDYRPEAAFLGYDNQATIAANTYGIFEIDNGRPYSSNLIGSQGLGNSINTGGMAQRNIVMAGELNQLANNPNCQQVVAVVGNDHAEAAAEPTISTIGDVLRDSYGFSDSNVTVVDMNAVALSCK